MLSNPEVYLPCAADIFDPREQPDIHTRAPPAPHSVGGGGRPPTYRKRKPPSADSAGATHTHTARHRARAIYRSPDNSRAALARRGDRAAEVRCRRARPPPSVGGSRRSPPERDCDALLTSPTQRAARVARGARAVRRGHPLWPGECCYGQPEPAN